MKHLEYARDKLIMGPERKLKINDTETNSITAYHEAGHALVAYYTKDAPALHKITIMPHGHSLGHVSIIICIYTYTYICICIYILTILFY